MKNIYILPTSKSTRGLVLLNSIYRIEKGLINYPKYLYPDAEGYDVYITSDEEIISFNEINSLSLQDGKDIQTNMSNI